MKRKLSIGLLALCFCFFQDASASDLSHILSYPQAKSPGLSNQQQQEKIRQLEKELEESRKNAEFYKKMYERMDRKTEQLIEIYDRIIYEQQKTIYELRNPDIQIPHSKKERV